MHAYGRKLGRNTILTFLCSVLFFFFFSFLLASYHRDAGIYESDTEIYESTEYRDLYTHVYNVYTIHMYLSTYDQLRVDRRNRILPVSNPVANLNN